MARQGRVKDGHGHSGSCFGHWEGSRARRGAGLGLGRKMMGCECGTRAQEVLPSLRTFDLGAKTPGLERPA